jgi:hypothetical protein
MLRIPFHLRNRLHPLQTGDHRGVQQEVEGQVGVFGGTAEHILVLAAPPRIGLGDRLLNLGPLRLDVFDRNGTPLVVRKDRAVPYCPALPDADQLVAKVRASNGWKRR